LYKRRDDVEQKRRWMLRAIAIPLGIATTRPVMGVFFATSPLTGLIPGQFFGIAFWIGFSLNTLVMEFWLRNRNLSIRA
jgi:zinc transporter ZupT